MNKMNPLEQQLQSWEPRRPSDKIRSRLFAPRISVESRFGHGFDWLAPAAALVLTMLILFQPNPFHGEARAGERSFSFLPVFSSQQSFALSKLDLNLEWNVWSKATFDWTNRNASYSLTNHLMH